MDEMERKSLLGAIRLEVSNAVGDATQPLSSRLDHIQNTVDNMRTVGDQRDARLTNEVASIREDFKRTRQVAEDAARRADAAKHEISTAYDAMKAHAKVVENQIGSFKHELLAIRDENHIQTETLTELVSSAATREERGQATKTVIDKLLVAEEDRSKKELVREALDKKAFEQKEVFWKRLPVYITLAIVLSGFLFWLLNMIIVQSKISAGQIKQPSAMEK